jgi:DNA-binding NarL/FixJ family response regulator
MSDVIRILLIDDHTLIRSGIRALLEKAKIEVVGEAGDGMEAARLAGQLAPDVILMDVNMPRLNGIEGVRQIVAVKPDARVLMLSMHADEQYVFESLRAGARGYVLKDAAFSELITAIRTVAGGKTYLAPELAELVTSDYIRRARGGGTEATGLERLSARERQVLQLVTAGHSSAEIANLLHISVRTVDTHRLHVMDKLGIRNIAELTKFAIRHGLCTV